MFKFMILAGLVVHSQAQSRGQKYATSFSTFTQYAGSTHHAVPTGTPRSGSKGLLYSPTIHKFVPAVHVATAIIHYTPIAHHSAGALPTIYYGPLTHHAPIIHEVPMVHHTAAAPAIHHAPVLPHTSAAAFKGYHSKGCYHAQPEYHFKYGVADRRTGNFHSQEEKRYGDKVKGHYMLHEADGTIRIVHYTADKHTGFNAIVEKKDQVRHPLQVYHH